MSRQIVIVVLCTMIGAVPLSATAQEQKRATPKADQEAQERAKQPDQERPRTAIAPRKPRGRDLNLQIELTITDTLGSAKPDTKVVSMLTADASMGRIRTVAGPMSAMLNVDATPTVLQNDRIHLQLTVEYAPAATGQGSPKPSTLHESLSVILENGKALVISQAADPVADRKMTVEIKASILK